MWISKPEELSRWALDDFVEGKGEEWQKQLITTEREAFAYCKLVEDDPKIRKLIKEPNWAFEYCKEIEHRFWIAVKMWWDPIYLEKYLLQVRGWKKCWTEIFLAFYCIGMLAFITPFCLVGMFFEWVTKNVDRAGAN